MNSPRKILIALNAILAIFAVIASMGSPQPLHALLWLCFMAPATPFVVLFSWLVVAFPYAALTVIFPTVFIAAEIFTWWRGKTAMAVALLVVAVIGMMITGTFVYAFSNFSIAPD